VGLDTLAFLLHLLAGLGNQCARPSMYLFADAFYLSLTSRALPFQGLRIAQ
jgi:hypothetical protein